MCIICHENGTAQERDPIWDSQWLLSFELTISEGAHEEAACRYHIGAGQQCSSNGYNSPKNTRPILGGGQTEEYSSVHL